MSDNLAKRIDRLESIEAIKKLKHLYMNYCDLGYPPAKLKGIEMLSPEVRAIIPDPTSPKTAVNNEDWWTDRLDELTKRFKEWQLT